MAQDDSANHIQLSTTEAVTASKPQRLEPELAGPVFALHMNVRGLIAVETREEEPIRPGNAFDSWHSKGLLPPAAQQTIGYPNQGLAETQSQPGA